MEIIKNKVEDIMVEVGYLNKEEYSDTLLNSLLNCWCCFDEKEREIQELLGVSSEIILYSKYYWCSRRSFVFAQLSAKETA